MEWCLACHREPERFIRPKDKVFDMKWPAENKTAEEIAKGRELVKAHDVKDSRIITSCSTCHR
jgi:hypothetical protein